MYNTAISPKRQGERVGYEQETWMGGRVSGFDHGMRLSRQDSRIEQDVGGIAPGRGREEACGIKPLGLSPRARPTQAEASDET